MTTIFSRYYITGQQLNSMQSLIQLIKDKTITNSGIQLIEEMLNDVKDKQFLDYDPNVTYQQSKSKMELDKEIVREGSNPYTKTVMKRIR